MSGPINATNGSDQRDGLRSDNNLPHALAISLLFHLLLISVVPERALLASLGHRPLAVRAVIQPKATSDSELRAVPMNTSSPASPPMTTKGEPRVVRESGSQNRLATNHQASDSEKGRGPSENESEIPPSLLDIEEKGLFGLSDGANAEGSLVARVTVNQHGRATHIKVLHSSLPAQVEEQVVSRLYWARYRPGEKDGHPVESVMFLEINASSDAKY